MPGNFRQSVLFTLLMSSLMVYCMSVYNMILRSDVWDVRLLVPQATAFVSELAVASLLSLFFVNASVSRALRPVISHIDAAVLKNVVLTAGIAGLMVPLMTLWVQLNLYGFHGFVWTRYGQAICFNFAMALSVQLLVVKPVVQFAFVKIVNFDFAFLPFKLKKR